MLGLKWDGLYVHVPMCLIVPCTCLSPLIKSVGLLCIMKTDYRERVELNLIALFRTRSVSYGWKKPN